MSEKPTQEELELRAAKRAQSLQEQRNKRKAKKKALLAETAPVPKLSNVAKFGFRAQQKSRKKSR